MALTERIAVVNVTTAANTPSSTPLLTAIDLGDVLVNSIYLRIPPGHAGLTGWQLQKSGNALVPFDQLDAWITGDNEVATFVISEEITTGLAIATYNTGTYPHTHYCRVDYTPISATSTSDGVPVTLAL